MDDEGGRDAGQADATLVPGRGLGARGTQDVLAEDDRVASGPAEQDHVGGVERGREEGRLAEDVLEDVLLAAVARDARAELDVDGRAGSGDQRADEPHEEGEADGAAECEDGAGRGEDTGADDTVDDEEGGRGDADGTLGLTGSLETAWVLSAWMCLIYSASSCVLSYHSPTRWCRQPRRWCQHLCPR